MESSAAANRYAGAGQAWQGTAVFGADADRVGAGDIQDRREPSAGVILYRAEMKQPGAFRDEIFCGAADDINKDDINKMEKENLK